MFNREYTREAGAFLGDGAWAADDVQSEAE